MMKPAVRNTLQFIGRAFALIGVIFVVLRLRLYWSEIDLARIAIPGRLLIAALSIVSGLSVLILATIWRRTLLALQAPVSLPWAIKTYCVTQLAKYLPGNVFHYAARQGTGMAANISAIVLAKSFFWEIIISLSAALSLGALALPLLLARCSMPTSVLLFMLVVVFIYLCLRRIVNKHMAIAFLMQLSFLLIIGGIFASLLSLVCEKSLPDNLWPALIGAYIIAWLIGFVTPGASGGIGVREMVALFLLQAFIPESTLLMAIILARMVSVVGDVFAFLIGHLVVSSKKIMNVDL